MGVCVYIQVRGLKVQAVRRANANLLPPHHKFTPIRPCCLPSPYMSLSSSSAAYFGGANCSETPTVPAKLQK